MKIVTDKRIPGLQEGIKSILPNAEIISKEGREISRDDLNDAEALIVRTRTRCDSSLLEGSGIRLIGTATIGTDHIDLDWCARNGIEVVNAPGSNAPAVMQYVASTLHHAGFDPARHTLGVVGKGHIGNLVTELYRMEGTKVVVCDPPRKDAGYDDEEYLSLEEVFAMSDAVTFHVPYTTVGPYPTRHLLKGPIPGRVAMIVNSSRGEVLDPSVIDPKRKFIIDTWPFEDQPEQFDDALRRSLIDASFIATPHIAGYSREGKSRATEAMIAAIARKFNIEATNKGKGFQKIDTSLLRYSLKDVIRSFNPIPLSEALKENPDSFETLRGKHLRPEPVPLAN